MKKAFTLFLCLFFAGLCAISPSLLLRGIHKNTYTLWAQERQARYTGDLVLWHIVSFKTGGESGVSYLKARIRAFEQQNPYVFVELRALSVPEAREAIAAGEFPDLVSFPLGFFADASALCPLPANGSLLRPFRQVGRSGGKVYAYPYMADFYTLSANPDAFFAGDTPLSLETEWSAPALSEWTQALLSAGTFSASLSRPAGSFPEAALFCTRNGALAEESRSFWQSAPADASAFWAGEVPLLLSPAAEIKRAESQSTVLSPQVYGFSDYTDLCQLIGVRAGMDAPKEAICQEFAAALLSRTAQRALASLYLLPTTAQEDLYADAPLYHQEYTRLQKCARVPNSFAFAAAPQLPTSAEECAKVWQLGK